ncbi:exodeoxyribonuclease V subunit alpha [Rhodococcus rhodnii]|uniref:RecBCD enzyme subunit RecD n=3 Tax=Rhodococcus rhodnii TaxID=38312 RepID=R7WQL8_9NOCA|nr:exodeoxyribonuclease V subunit alpha [Rhodococcus rhodnii]EOM77575.1 exodeoxyribonuclease V alpha chain [Rhodococcus rhodnii LMG 5362]TXG89209.1 exodeoxyribonuclease V subunit alpha [Rhodococcus rhodnii]
MEALVPVAASGLVGAFAEAGVLTAADVHVAHRLGRLGGEASERVLLAAALAVRAVRSGSVCLDVRRLSEVTVDELSDDDIAALPWPDPVEVVAELRKSPLVIGGAGGPLVPLRLVDSDEGELLYLARYFAQEQQIRTLLDVRAEDVPRVRPSEVRAALDALFVAADGSPARAPDRQRIAAALAACRWTTVIAGGPGTGKTHTVARILALLVRASPRPLRIGLAAPTGKAAARLQESIDEQSGVLGLPPGPKAMTLHRLLGWRRGGGSRFRWNADNRLPYDVVVVDETSMVSLTLMCRVLEAMRPDARLILVGDPDQLTSVDAGAVLADLVARPVHGEIDVAVRELVSSDLDAASDPDEAALSAGEHRRLASGIVRLSRGRRFGGDIAALAVAIRDGDDDRVVEVLSSGSDAVSWRGSDDIAELRDDVVRSSANVTRAALAGDADGALARLEEHRLLCAHREGPYGVRQWARHAMEWVAADTGRALDPGGWCPGQPLLVAANDHELQIYNGDTGVVVQLPDGSLGAAFARGHEAMVIPPSRLADTHTVYAMTIHRSQGSQYDVVSVVLPEESSSLLTRELLYTAVTRARRHVRILGSEEAVRAGVRRRVLRASGLRREIRPYPR